MFKSSRIKIIVSIMGSLLVLFALTLGLILLTSYRDIRRDSADKLEQYSNLYHLDSQKEAQNPPEAPESVPEPAPEPSFEGQPERKQKKDNPPMEERSDYMLSTFYSVAFARDGEVIRTDDGDRDVYNSDELVEIATGILAGGSQSGQTGNLAYLVTRRPGYTLVAMLDNTMAESSMDMLVRNFLIVGGGALVVLFFVSLLISKLIIRPLAENDLKQKQFISDASHELKTPISVVGANAEMLSREIGKNEWLSNIMYENDRMGTLVKQLLDLSRAENAGLQMEQVDLSMTVMGDVLAFESLAFENGKSFESDVEEGIGINGNRTQLEQLVSVLLDNAIKYSTGSVVSVSLKRHSHAAVLSVSNEGSPIPAEKQKHLFDRFYRVDEVRNSDDGHYGLGLAIAKAVTDRHRGSIGVSCHDGKVVFTATLPL